MSEADPSVTGETRVAEATLGLALEPRLRIGVQTFTGVLSLHRNPGCPRSMS